MTYLSLLKLGYILCILLCILFFLLNIIISCAFKCLLKKGLLIKHQGNHLSATSVQFNCSVVSNFLQPHGLQYARLPCPSPSSRVWSNSCPLSWWCHHPTISSSVIPFSSCLQSFPAWGSFQMSQFFAFPSCEFNNLVCGGLLKDYEASVFYWEAVMI